MNICIEIGVLMVNCIPNHTKFVDISPDFVIASIKKIKMAINNSQNCYNFGLHVNICMTFCVLMASCIHNRTKCEHISADSNTFIIINYVLLNLNICLVNVRLTLFCLHSL